MLTREQLSLYREQGFVVARGMLGAADFAPLLREYEGVLARLCESLARVGEISRDYAELPFAERFLAMCRETGKAFPRHFSFVLPRGGVRADTPIWLGDAVFGILTHSRILDAVESLIGPEIAVSPVGNVRVKPPEKLLARVGEERSSGLVGVTPWHQDNGVVAEEADDTDMITVWFPLTDAPIESGCLQVAPQSHRAGLACHCPSDNGELTVPTSLLPEREPLPLPMRAGDVLFLHRRLLHSALPNVGATVRWSFDLRYMPTGQPSGREAFPSFVARSRRDPRAVVSDPQQWRGLWEAARAQMIENPDAPWRWNRWRADAALCA